ncbi:MAG: transglycosylase family protein [Actinobacteria bacterium]|nr:transglycosylase family protein [Actinomycetota bacterium]
MNSKSLTRALALLAVLGAFLITACSPEEAALVAAHVQSQQAATGGDRFANAISDAGLARLRACESGGNYSSVSSGGLYRGAYQFHRGTWNSTAARFYPHLQGVDPAAAAPFDQDRMTRALWATSGPQNWPVCSKRV